MIFRQIRLIDSVFFLMPREIGDADRIDNSMAFLGRDDFYAGILAPLMDACACDSNSIVPDCLARVLVE